MSCHNAEPLIVGDSLTYGDPIESGELDAREMDGMTVVNLWKKDNDTLQFRREAGVQRKRGRVDDPGPDVRV